MIKDRGRRGDFGKNTPLTPARHKLGHLFAQIPGKCHAMPPIAKSIVNAVDPANVRHQIEGDAQPAGPGMGNGYIPQLRKNMDQGFGQIFSAGYHI